MVKLWLYSYHRGGRQKSVHKDWKANTHPTHPRFQVKYVWVTLHWYYPRLNDSHSSAWLKLSKFHVPQTNTRDIPQNSPRPPLLYHSSPRFCCWFYVCYELFPRNLFCEIFINFHRSVAGGGLGWVSVGGKWLILYTHGLGGEEIYARYAPSQSVSCLVFVVSPSIFNAP